jgi:DNA processing protein
MSELLYRIALTKIPKVGAVIAKTLISHCGSAEAVFKSSKKSLLKIPSIGEAIADSLLNQNVLTWAEKEYEYIQKNNINVLFHTDETYPQRLRDKNDCPVLLYYKGTADLNHSRIISIVGTRKPTAYGTRLCEEITEGLAQRNVLIVSGLAFGIDITAHRKCLEMSAPTIGIMGNGLQRIYPTEHREYARRMLENGGLLTEYPSDTDPDKMNFPMRNRIIAGMCDALLVVETAQQGGSMITAHMALAYGKEIFALPGRAGEKMAQGGNYLIKNNKATLVETAEDIAQSLLWQGEAAPKAYQLPLFPELTESEQIVVNILRNTEGGVLIDALSHQTQLSHSRIAATLLDLEFKGLVKSLPGKRYSLGG